MQQVSEVYNNERRLLINYVSLCQSVNGQIHHADSTRFV
jgi:hypothetical protein